MNREHFLKTLGYQEPYDESPVDTPEGWHGGTVTNTGGNIMCRIWRTWVGNEKASPVEYEVIYDVSMDNGVALERYRYDEQEGYYVHEETEKVRKAKYQSDTSQAETALDLMQQVDQERVDTSQEHGIAEIRKIERDIEEITHNYGRDLYLNDQALMHPFLMYKNSEHEHNIADEVVSVIAKRGYDVSYVDYNEREIAFTVQQGTNFFSQRVTNHIRSCLSTWDLEMKNEPEVRKVTEGYEVALEYSGEFLRDTMMDGQGPLLYLKEDVEILYRGTRDGKLLLTVKLHDEKSY